MVSLVGTRKPYPSRIRFWGGKAWLGGGRLYKVLTTHWRNLWQLCWKALEAAGDLALVRVLPVSVWWPALEESRTQGD